MSIVPFGIAWYLAEHPETVKLGTNHGQLIDPPLATEISGFSGYDDFSAQNMQELKGHWVLVNLVAGDVCSEACLNGLYKTQQITLMMGKDIARIRRLALIDRKTVQPLSQQWQEDARLLKAVASAELKQTFQQIGGVAEPGGLLIMDPLGNLMMHYPADYDPYQVRNDLSKLLRISQIG